MERKGVVSPDSALGADIFDKFCSAQTLKSILGHFRHLCQVLHIQPTNFHQFYPKLKSKLRSWKAQALWNKFDKRASHKCYNRGKACHNTRVLVIGAGPCGLRAAIEAQLLGCKVVVMEKRDRMSRNNVLHLWPYVIHDLRGLGAKKFFGKFCAGAIDHISIRQLQCILLKVALIFGVEIHEGVGFESLSSPREDENERVGWRAVVDPPDHPVRQYEFDVLIGADGKRNTLDGFKRKEFRGKLAIAITANFINRRTEAEARVEEISGVAFIFNQSFFRELYERTGIDLENIVYYKDETHYFVMTAKKHSLIDKGVILNDYSDTFKLLSADNVDRTALMEYAREAADFSSRYKLPQLDFAVNHYGQPDVAMFDFTSMYAAENASRVLEVNGHRLLVQLVGDSLLEPFWPTGSGCARGFLSCMDACWALRSWALGAHPLQVVAERESIYRLLAQTTPENLHRDHQGYTLDPHTRYPNLNINAVLPIQVKGLYATDDPTSLETYLKAPSTLTSSDLPKKRRRRDSQVAPETLLHWLQRQVTLYENVKIEDMTSSFKDGIALCAIIYRYRPHLIPDFHTLNRQDVAKNNQLAFDILEKEFAIPPVLRGEDMANCEEPDQIALLSYLSQVYDAFRGEIPHIKHPKLEDLEEEEGQNHKDTTSAHAHAARLKAMREMSTSQKVSLLSRISSSKVLNTSKHHHVAPRKRRSTNISDRENRSLEGVKKGGKDQDFSVRVKDLEAKLRGALQGKKPKDLLRAIGKIEKTDWNVKEIEKKIHENRMGRGLTGRAEKVPKWSKEQFNDKFSVMEKKLQGQLNDDNRYQEIDNKLAVLERKVKEGSTLEVGQRGSNKVSVMAATLAASIHQEPSKQSNNSEGATKKEVILASNGGSETCHFCNKRVYLMERQTAEGRFFHRGCFRCQYCHTALRLGNYLFDREGRYGRRFYCMQHFGMDGNIKDKRRSDLKSPRNPVPVPSTPSTEQVDQVVSHTPERIEFENLSECVEVEEDEWTDRNFGPTSTDSSDLSESSSESGDEEALAEALEAGLDPEETLRLAEDWTKRYASCTDTSYHHSPDEDSDSKESEAEEMKKARELRKQEVPAEPVRPSNSDTGSDTEVGSDEYSESSSEESDQEDNSATEISTDSEFEHDGTTHTIPDIVISDAVQVKKGELDQPKQVQLINRPLNGKIETITKDKDIKLELRKIEDWKHTPLKPIVNNDKPLLNNVKLQSTNDNALLNNRPKPLVNPNKGDYLINRTQSTEGIASKISLELKKKYLLGSAGGIGNVKKSGSTSTLDTKFKSLIDQISENQKMLNPAPEPSPTMQAILQGADKIKTSPVVSPLPNLLLRKQLPAYHDFKHVCGLKEEKENKENEEKNKIRDEIESVVPKENDVDKKIEDEEVRPRSPVHETSIVVPHFPRADINEEEMDSDSLSSSSEESTDEDSLEEGSNEALVHSPPKLEIHNSRGELMDEDGLHMDNNLPDVCQNEPVKDKVDLVPSSSESRDTSLGKMITVPCPDKSDGELLKKVATPRELYVTPEPPTSPESKDDSDSLKNESIAAQLTETELSDWARDEEPMASEALYDFDLTSDSQFVNFRKHQGPKNRRNVRGVAAKIAKAENFDDEFTHVCGKIEKPDSLPVSSVLSDTDNIRFMDTGEEDEVSTDEDGGVKNKALINNGYVPLVSPSDDDDDELATPLVESQNFEYLLPCKEDEDSKHTEFTDTTTTSDATTVKNPIEKSSSSSASELRDNPKPLEVAERDYETYVQRLQGRISPFRNARDSIGIIKDKKKYKLPHSKSSDDTTQDDSVTKSSNDNDYKATTNGRGITSPTTSRKLQQISKERSFQKDLVHEMVMNKLISQGKSPVERNKKRSSRGSCSPLGGILTSSSVSSIASSALPKEDSVKSSQQLSKSSMYSVDTNKISQSEAEWSTPVSRRVGSLSERGPVRPRSVAVTSTPHGNLPSSSEAFSLPDIYKAVESEFKTPLGPPPTLRSDLRESAKAKYKMMSDEELGLSPEEKLKRLRERFNKYLSSSFEKLSTPSTSANKAEDVDKSKKGGKETPDRKRSIIQAVSDFFHKKSPSPPKTPSSHSPTKLLKFKSSKSKESIAEEPPPIPPLPQSYTPSHDDSWSEDDSKMVPDDQVASAVPKKHKLSQRLLRQAQNKRLRMAQEMQRELEEIEVKQRELEARGVAVEKAIRGEQPQGMKSDNEASLSELFALMRESSRLRAREKELSISAQQLELDDRHARLQHQFKLLVNSQDKNADDVALEGELLREMLEIVERKEFLAKQLQLERLRSEDEYKNLEAQMLAKGLRAPSSSSQSTSMGGPGHTPGPANNRPPLAIRKNSY